MKDFLKNNYNIIVDKLYNCDNQIYFFINCEKIYIIKCDLDKEYLDYLISLSNNLFYDGINVNTFIMNNQKEFYTKKDNYFYLLMKSNSFECVMDIDTISKFEKYDSLLNNFNIYYEWQKEIDNIEKELIEYNKEFVLIQKSINYFIGLGENAIELIGFYEKLIDKYNSSIGHDISCFFDKKNTIYNPFSFIKVNRMYDIANYVKRILSISELDYSLIDKIIEKCSEYELIYLFACIIYPSDYFYVVKKVILGEYKEDMINIFVSNIENQKKLIEYIQSKIINKDVKLITWIYE